MKIKTEVEISDERISDLLCTALEGGSNYWYGNVWPLKKTHRDKEYSDRLYKDILKHGFTINDNLHEPKPKRYTIRPDRFQKALQLMADQRPEHFLDIINDQDDAGTGDIFLQLCVFGQVIYG